jgi:hypothetical protein
VSGIEINSLLIVEMNSEFRVSPVGGNVVMRPEYAFDIAGNNVKVDWEYVDKIEKERQEEIKKYIATIKDLIPIQSLYKISPDFDFETLLKNTLPPINEVIVKPDEKKRSVSPCPCGSKECLEYYEKNK